MQLVTTGPRPKPAPDWTGIKVATHQHGMKVMRLESTGSLGRAEGYDSSANALRAARMLTRGDVRDAAAVIGYEGRYYVQSLRASDPWGRWQAPLRFEAAFPAVVGPMVLHERSTFNAHLAGLQAIVDGSRSLRVST